VYSAAVTDRPDVTKKGCMTPNKFKEEMQLPEHKMYKEECIKELVEPSEEKESEDEDNADEDEDTEDDEVDDANEEADEADTDSLPGLMEDSVEEDDLEEKIPERRGPGDEEDFDTDEEHANSSTDFDTDEEHANSSIKEEKQSNLMDMMRKNMTEAVSAFDGKPDVTKKGNMNTKNFKRSIAIT
jgi:hypothetical protein